MKNKPVVLMAFLLVGFVSVQSVQADGFKLLKFGNEIWDVLRKSGKFTDEAVDVIRMTGKFTDEAVDVLRLSDRYGDEAIEALRIGGHSHDEVKLIDLFRIGGRYSDEAIETLHIGGRYSDEVIDLLHTGSRYSDEGFDASRMSIRHGDKISDGVSTGVSRRQKTWKRVYVDEFGNISDVSPQGMAAFLEKYDQMIAQGATHAEAKAAATIVQEQMDNLCLNGYIINTLGN
jgi:hypothetical protein